MRLYHPATEQPIEKRRPGQQSDEDKTEFDAVERAEVSIVVREVEGH